MNIRELGDLNSSFKGLMKHPNWIPLFLDISSIWSPFDKNWWEKQHIVCCDNSYSAATAKIQKLQNTLSLFTDNSCRMINARICKEIIELEAQRRKYEILVGFKPNGSRVNDHTKKAQFRKRALKVGNSLHTKN